MPDSTQSKPAANREQSRQLDRHSRPADQQSRLADQQNRLADQQNRLADQQSRLAARPIGLVQPGDGPALEAALAIEDRRPATPASWLADAQRLTDAMTDDALDARAWRALLLGLISIRQGELARAEPLLLEASALALADGVTGEKKASRPAEQQADHLVQAGADMLRLGARALVHLGWLYRRTERCADATRVHLAAHRLRRDHGSHEELWESATELGLDADVAREFEDGQRWHRKAIEAAEHASQQSLKKQAQAWTNLVTSHEAAEQFEQAVDAARTARDCWHRHDSTAVTAARADAKLGKALLSLGETLSHAGEHKAVEVLAEAVRLLAKARDALLAFGPDFRTEADSCHDQQQLATRLDEEVKSS